MNEANLFDVFTAATWQCVLEKGSEENSAVSGSGKIFTQPAAGTSCFDQ